MLLIVEPSLEFDRAGRLIDCVVDTTAEYHRSIVRTEARYLASAPPVFDPIENPAAGDGGVFARDGWGSGGLGSRPSPLVARRPDQVQSGSTVPELIVSTRVGKAGL